MHLKQPLRFSAAALGICLVATGSGPAPAAVAAASGSAVMPFRAHVYFDNTTGPPPPGIVRGARANPLTHPKTPLAGVASAAVGAAATSGQSGAGAPPDPEILGFVQYGEVLSGAWATDLHFNQLSTISYFGVNVNTNATLVTSDAGYTTWWSSAETDLINAAHNAG